MTLGCGSWGGNVTSDNVGPLHLMDIKRVAFETRPVNSVRPVASAQRTVAPPIQTSMREPAIAGGKINRQEIAAIVDRFLAGKGVENVPASSPLPKPPLVPEAGSMYTGPDMFCSKIHGVYHGSLAALDVKVVETVNQQVFFGREILNELGVVFPDKPDQKGFVTNLVRVDDGLAGIDYALQLSSK